MPLVIPYRCTHAVPVIRVVSERANAKEALLVLQEILERLSHDEEPEDEGGQEEISEKLSPTLQLERVIFSYAYGKITPYSVGSAPHGTISFATNAAQGEDHGRTPSSATQRSREIHSSYLATLTTTGRSSRSPFRDYPYQQALGLLCGSSFRCHPAHALHRK